MNAELREHVLPRERQVALRAALGRRELDLGARRRDAAGARQQRAVPDRDVERDVEHHRQRRAARPRSRRPLTAARRSSGAGRKTRNSAVSAAAGSSPMPDSLVRNAAAVARPSPAATPGRQPDAERPRDEVEQRRRRGGDPGVGVDRAADEREVGHQRAHQPAGDPRPAVPRQQLAQEQRHEEDRQGDEQRRADPHRVEPVERVAARPRARACRARRAPRSRAADSCRRRRRRRRRPRLRSLVVQAVVRGCCGLGRRPQRAAEEVGDDVGARAPRPRRLLRPGTCPLSGPGRGTLPVSARYCT